MRKRPPTLRVAALLAVAALVLHELRYLAGYGGHADAALAGQGHAYLALLSPAAAVLLALAAAQLLRALRRAGRAGTACEAAPGFLATWAGASAGLLCVHAGQELAEGWLAAGHPAGLAALTAHGGAVAVPLALALGALVALGVRGAAVAVELAARRSLRRSPVRAPAGPGTPSASPELPAPAVLARNLAGRAPPVSA